MNKKAALQSTIVISAAFWLLLSVLVYVLVY